MRIEPVNIFNCNHNYFFDFLLIVPLNLKMKQLIDLLVLILVVSQTN